MPPAKTGGIALGLVVGGYEELSVAAERAACSVKQHVVVTLVEVVLFVVVLVVRAEVAFVVGARVE